MKKIYKIIACVLCCVAVVFTAGCSWGLNLHPRHEEPTEIDYVITGTESSTNDATEALPTTDLGDTTPPRNLEVKDGSVVEMGGWGAYYVWNYDTNKLFTTYMRVSGVTTESADKAYVKAAIDEFNTEMGGNRKINIDDIEDGLEYAVVDVNLVIPEGQDVKDYDGAPLPLTIRLKADGSWKDANNHTYIFTTSLDKIKLRDKKISSGHQCNTKMIYKIIKNTPTPYSLECSYQTPIKDKYGEITFRLT